MNLATPGFQTWTVIFLLAAIQAMVLSSILAFIKRGNRKANRILAIIIGLFGITLIHYVVYWTGYMQIYPHFMALSNTFPFLYGPLLLIYFHYLSDRPLNKRYWLHVVPFMIHLIWLSPLYLSSTHEKLAILGRGNPINYLFIPWAQILHLFIYAEWARRFNKKEGNYVTWRNILLASYIGFGLSFMSYYMLILHPDFSLSWDYMVSGSMTVFIFMVALMGYIQPDIFSGKTIREALGQSKYVHSRLTPQVAEALLIRLDHLMEDKFLFKNPELTLEMLAGDLGVSKHEVSQLINEYKKKSFSEYINELRVKSIVKQFHFSPNQDTPAIQLAYEVGFNNKVSFYQHFKKYTGKTPGQYRKTVNIYRN